MDGYSPKLVIGVEHKKKAIRPVLDFIDGKVKPGTTVGTEAYSYPVDHIEDHWEKASNSEFVDFYDAVGDFVTSRGGIYVPLQDFADFRNFYLSHNPDFIEEEQRHRSKLLEALSEGGIDTSIANPLALALNDDAGPVVRAIGRISRRMYLREGINPDEDRDNRLVDRVREREPEYIITGWGHIPALMVEYPQMGIKIIR